MNTWTETMGNKLNDLLEKTNDVEKGFRKAAENTNHTYLKKYFQNKAQERNEFGNELKLEITSLGEEIEKEGSFTGAAHRAWMDIKALFSLDSDESMLKEALKGEKAALEEYDEILNETSLPYSTQSVLLKQREAIANDLNTIKRLEDIR